MAILSHPCNLLNSLFHIISSLIGIGSTENNDVEVTFINAAHLSLNIVWALIRDMDKPERKNLHSKVIKGLVDVFFYLIRLVF